MSDAVHYVFYIVVMKKIKIIYTSNYFKTTIISYIWVNCIKNIRDCFWRKDYKHSQKNDLSIVVIFDGTCKLIWL